MEILGDYDVSIFNYPLSELENDIKNARDCKYINIETYKKLMEGYDEVRKMLISMINNPDKFCKQPDFS